MRSTYARRRYVTETYSVMVSGAGQVLMSIGVGTSRSAVRNHRKVQRGCRHHKANTVMFTVVWSRLVLLPIVLAAVYNALGKSSVPSTCDAALLLFHYLDNDTQTKLIYRTVTVNVGGVKTTTNKVGLLLIFRR